MRSAASSPSARWCRSRRHWLMMRAGPRRAEHRARRDQYVRRLRRHAAHAADVPQMMPATLSSVAYVGATILFILSLGGLSNPETSRRGNLYGMIGMTIAVLATVFGPQVTSAGYPWLIGAM